MVIRGYLQKCRLHVNQRINLLLDSVATAFVAVLLLRFHLQVTRASYNNPLSQFGLTLTDFAVKPMRRVIPGLWGLISRP